MKTNLLYAVLLPHVLRFNASVETLSQEVGIPSGLRERVHRHDLVVGCSHRLPVFGKRSLCVVRRGRFLNTGKRRLHHSTHHLIRDGVLGRLEEKISVMAELALQDPCAPGNPREMSIEDAISIYSEVL